MSSLNSNERTYHETSSAYSLPNDPQEHERLFLQTQAINQMMHNERVHAPVASPSRILEVGCGTGHMTNYVAEKFPNASEILGLDLSPVPQAPARPGVKFLQGDFWETVSKADSETFKNGSFDYIFSRMLVFGMKDWSGYVARAKELLKPGGWLEIQDLDFLFMDADGNPLSDNQRWYINQRGAFLKNGIDIEAPRKLEGYIRAAGFVDVKVKVFHWVYGKWPGHPETDMMGQYAAKYVGAANEVAYRKVLGILKTKEELQEEVDEMRARVSYDDSGMHQRYFVVCGRKP